MAVMRLSVLFLWFTQVLLLVGNGSAFSFAASSKNSAILKNPASGSRRNPSTQTRLRSKAHKSYFIMDENYDYDELMNSAAEQDRLNGNYVRFGHENWLRHRASDRFYRNLLKFRASPIVQNLIDEVAVLILVSLSIILWNGLVVDGYTDFGGVPHDPIFAESSNPLPFNLPHAKLALPLEPFLLSGGPLGLLLVFRNDASFGRYKEGFHLWEKIVSDFSNMLLMASNASPSEIEHVRKMGIASWALCRTLQHEVSGEFDPDERYEKDIRDKYGIDNNEEQADRLLTARNKLYRALFDIHQTIEPFTDEITLLDKRALINTVNDVAGACVECERLYHTPIPLLYTRHTLKFLTFWMTFMPFALYDVFASSWNHALMIPAISILAFLFFGVEEIAVSLEEPFSILPIDELVEELYLSVGDVTEWIATPQEEK